jgi:hypothetical protein
MIDLLAPLIARGAQQKTQLLRQAGGTRSTGEVSKILGISREALQKRRCDGQLLAVPHGDHYLYPACQFLGDRVVPGLDEVLQDIGLDRPWAALAFLMTPDDQLGNLSPLTALQRNDARLTKLTLRLARAAAGDGMMKEADGHK